MKAIPGYPQLPGRRLKRGDGRLAFTLTELLVVLAIIALLGGLLLPVLAKAKSKAQSAVCASNLRQLGAAFMLYLDDNKDVFPTGAASSALSAQPEDWIWWQTEIGTSGQPSMRDGRDSALTPYLDGYNSSFFRCPSDKDALAREMTWKATHQEIYTYSYSLNAHSMQGMASYISKDRSQVFESELSRITNPSSKIMLAEEKGSPSDGPGTAFIDDGRWLPLGYPLTMRHSGKANVTFADSHVESVPREFADIHHPEHFDPAY